MANLSFGLIYFGMQHICKYSGIRMHVLQTGDKNTLIGDRKNPYMYISSVVPDIHPMDGRQGNNDY